MKARMSGRFGASSGMKGAAWMAVAAAGWSALAQPAPKLSKVSREWVQRGTVAELTLSGENLSQASKILISGAQGMAGEIVPPAAPALKVESALGGISAVAPPDAGRLAIRLKIDPNAPLVERELRVSGPGGVSNPVTVRAGNLPEVDAAGNLSRENPQNLALPAMVSGVISAAAQSHYFRLSAMKGETLVLDVRAYRMGSKLDSSLALYDKAGKELARAEDISGLDSTLVYTAAEAGQFIVELRDFRYQGGGDYPYRLSAGALPHVASAFPFGGQRGQTVEVQLQGVNLGDASKMLLHLAADAPPGRQEIRASTPLGLSNPFPFDANDLPHLSEAEPNSALDQADRITPPAAANGRIGKERDYDAFRFRAEPGQRLVFEVDAQRYGSALDAVLILLDASGQVLARNDDAAGMDARIDHTFKEGGDYFAVLEDLLGRGGESFTYRLSVTAPPPDFSVVFLPDTPRLRRGGRAPIRCEVSYANGFSDAVKITAEDLPPGVYAEPLLLDPSGPGSGLLLLSARADAALGAFPLKLSASGLIRGKPARRGAQPISGDKGAKAAYLAVLEAAPYSIEPASLLASAEQSQMANLEVAVERGAGFAGEIKIVPEGFSAGREGPGKSFEFQPLVIKPGETRGTLALRAKSDAEIGARQIILKAEAEQNGNVFAEYSAPIPVVTLPIPFTISTSLKKLIVTALPANSGSAASEAAFAVKAQRRDGFAGDIELKLEGLPEGVEAVVGKIAASTGEVPIKLTASDKAPAGTNLQLRFVGSGLHRDRTYHFSAEPVTLTINAPEPAESKDAKDAKDPKLAKSPPAS